MDARALSPPPPANDEERQANRLYADKCASCHEHPEAPGAARSPIGLNSSWWLEKPDNIVRIVVDGIPPGQLGTPTMPGFRKTLTEDQLVALIGYQRTSRTGLPLWPYLHDTVKGWLAEPPPY
jgi:mono/diheme cytochrome c family protein